MQEIRLVHWNAAEARERAARLRAAGYRVVHASLEGATALRELTRKPPAAVVIDLGRMPSQGRDLALLLRGRKATRHLPLVFVEGAPEKVERIKKLLPDAVYTPWSRIRSSLKRALARPPKDPAVPASGLAGYSGTPLPKKLGIKPGSVVALVGAPRDFDKTLGTLPEDVTVRRQRRGRCDRIIWFTKTQAEVKRDVRRVARSLDEKGGLWIAWPKKSSGVTSDLTQNDVRRIGLASGLVDYKICAIDETWSGLLFARREPK